jgi:Uma2 family endonuclease
MTITTLLTVDQFIAQYGDDSRYELADGELIDMEPTGPHETVSGKLAIQIGGSPKQVRMHCSGLFPALASFSPLQMLPLLVVPTLLF